MSAPAGAAMQTGAEGGDRFELAFVLWDPLAEVAYTLDLGLIDDAFFAQAQDDAGYQRFWTLSPAADPNLARFRTAVTSPGGVRWGVMGFDDGSFGGAGEARFFTTLEQGTAQGVRNENYTKLSNLPNITVQSIVSTGAVNWMTDINSNAEDPLNTSVFRPGLTIEENFAINGSSFNVKGGRGYFAANGIETLIGCCNATNLVGKSSWFYFGTTSEGSEGDPILLDEFDNLSADGYWGLAIHPTSGDYILSYTMTPALNVALALTAAGQARAALTEYRSGEVFLPIAAPAGEYASYAPPSFAGVSAVPESPALMLLLAGGLFAVVQRRVARRRGRTPARTLAAA